MTSKPLDLSAAKALCENATQGEWFADDRGWLTASIPGDERSGMEREIFTLGADGTPADLRFAERARTLVPQLIAEVERLSVLLPNPTELAGLRAVHFNAGPHGSAAEAYADRIVDALWTSEMQAPEVDPRRVHNRDLRSQLAAILAAKDEACRIAERAADAANYHTHHGERQRISHLATIGHSSGEE